MNPTKTVNEYGQTIWIDPNGNQIYGYSGMDAPTWNGSNWVAPQVANPAQGWGTWNPQNNTAQLSQQFMDMARNGGAASTFSPDGRYRYSVDPTGVEGSGPLMYSIYDQQGQQGTPINQYDAQGNFIGTRAASGSESTKNFLIALAAAGGIAAAGAGAGAAGASSGGAAGSGAGFVGEGAASGIGAWDGALAGATPGTVGAGAAGAGTATMGAGGGGGGSGAFLGEGATSGVPAWDAAAAGGSGANTASNSSWLQNILKGSGMTTSTGEFNWGSLVGPATQLVGGYLNANASDKASDALLQASREAAARFEPWTQAGGWSIGQAANMLGKNGPAAAQAAFMQSPDYQWRLKQGENALTRAAAARGLLGSGRFLKDAMDYNQNQASSEYSNSLNRLLAVAGMGQTATNSAADYGVQGANAQAAGIVGKANAYNNALTQGASMYQTNRLLSGLGY